MDAALIEGLTGPWALAWLVLMIVADGFFPPVPSEVALIAAGGAAAEGRLSLPVLIALGALGCWLADLAVYLLFRYRLTGLLDRVGWGKRIHSTLHTAVERFGSTSTYGAIVGIRFLSGGRLAASATSGVAEVPLRGYAAASAVGSVLWSAWHVGLGYVTGTATGLPFWASALIGSGIGLTVALVFGAAVAARQRRLGAGARRTRGFRHNSEPIPPENGPTAP
ncbi:hypothetical protein GCM10027449_06510 [Sinomonas notoginsengisoli]|uniref:DedA family protein n=1 Tax=Sinomonas notoginsengisoli TaxID=1457311 RepID=UPI001F3C6FCD|nr:VTT domain-containing protein [Sinomonas notoginsengisoli]